MPPTTCGPGAKIDSWDVVFKPENLAKFKDCGIHMLDSADDILPAALNYLGIDPNSTGQADLDKAAELVSKVRPFVRKFHSSEYLGALASGEICFVVGWSGDVMQARSRAEEAKNGIEIGYAIPKEGAQMFFDNLAIPSDAKNVAEAYELINYLYRPDVAAKNSNFLSYANGNLASQKLIDAKIFDDRNIYPDEATQKKLFVITARDPATQRIQPALDQGEDGEVIGCRDYSRFSPTMSATTAARTSAPPMSARGAGTSAKATQIQKTISGVSSVAIREASPDGRNREPSTNSVRPMATCRPPKSASTPIS